MINQLHLRFFSGKKTLFVTGLLLSYSTGNSHETDTLFGPTICYLCKKN